MCLATMLPADYENNGLGQILRLVVVIFFLLLFLTLFLVGLLLSPFHGRVVRVAV